MSKLFYFLMDLKVMYCTNVGNVTLIPFFTKAFNLGVHKISLGNPLLAGQMHFPCCHIKIHDVYITVIFPLPPSLTGKLYLEGRRQ